MEQSQNRVVDLVGVDVHRGPPSATCLSARADLIRVPATRPRPHRRNADTADAAWAVTAARPGSPNRPQRSAALTVADRIGGLKKARK
jgi:hypothetical protein